VRERERESTVTVKSGLCLLGEKQLPLQWRGDGLFFGSHQKMGHIGELLEQEIYLIFSNMTSS
jgi:hypothetical protein